MKRNLKNFFIHYFYPHETNNYKAKTLHASSFLVYLILLLFIQLFFQTFRRFRPDILGFATDISTEKILMLVNQRRKQTNLPPLAVSPELTAAAQRKATDMFNYNYWAHVSPTGVTPWEFITRSGYRYIYAGENLAKDFNTSEEVVAAWMNSPTHRANILKPEYKEIGIAVVNGRLLNQETSLVVQEFGTSKRSTKGIAAEPTDVPSTEGSSLADNPETAKENTLVSEIKSGAPIFRLSLSRNFSFILTEFLLLVLFIDSLYIWRFKTVRLSSHSFAHFIFLAALIGAISLTGIGAVL